MNQPADPGFHIHIPVMPNRRGTRKERICSWCSQSFSKDEHLARHVRSHTKEKPFSCSSCGKSFTRHDSVLRHERSHTDAQRLRTPLYQSTQKDVSETAEGSVSTLLDSPAVDTAINRPSNYAKLNAARAEPLHHSSPSIYDSQTANPLPCDYSTLSLAGMPDWVESTFPHSLERSGPAENSPVLERLETGIDPSTPWIISPSQQIPGWLVGDDFDMNALNAQIFPTSISMAPFEWSSDGFLPGSVASHVNDVAVQSPKANIITEPRDEYIRRNWFSHLGIDRSGYITPDSMNEPTTVDERYRENLSRELQQRIVNEPLPSTDFLNLCIQMYFTKFNPIFPVVHAPTFCPSPKRSLLLLSICSVGSLFLGSSFAAAQGVKIFERLNKAILASWESYIVRGAADALALTQAALIGQTFGMLSGNPRHLAIVQTFHGTIIAWARRQNMFQQKTPETYPSSLVEPDIESFWRRWIHNEEKRRVAMGLRVHDAELAELLMVEPYLRSTLSQRPTIGHDIIWTAPTAKDWACAIREHSYSNSPESAYQANSINQNQQLRDGTGNKPSRPPPPFSIYALLEEKISCIMENSDAPPLKGKLEEFIQPLIHIYTDQLLKKMDSDPFSLKALWHSVFISLYSDMNMLECAVGRDGFDEAQSQNKHAIAWASSADGHRCAAHAALILRHLQRIPVGEEPAIHVPRLLYRVSIVWYSYTHFGRDDPDSSNLVEVDFIELNKVGIDGQRTLFAANGFKKTRPTTSESSTLFQAIDLLARLGHWGISQKMASMISILVHGKQNND